MSELTTIPAEERGQVGAAAETFREEIESEVKARVEIFKKYNATMVKAGAPYRYRAAHP